MPEINEATDTDLKVIERLTQLGWRLGIGCFIIAMGYNYSV